MLAGLPASAASSFFLLSDASYGSKDQARVRLEISDQSAVQNYGGMDIAVYRVKDPLKFLAAQHNLHRIQVEPNYADNGLWALISRSWDSFAEEARLSWRRLFSSHARGQAVAANPDLATGTLRDPRPEPQNRRFGPLAGYELASVFRYPVQFAQTIKPPADVKMEGSSSDFIPPQEGNVYVPLGRLEPGLYVVEAATGSQRAVTAVFVADTVLVTKVSSTQMLAWTVNRDDGAPVAGAQSWWTDGEGVLARGTSDARGLATLVKNSPERSYVYGADPKGGVYISENYYYDSEIYNTKVYAATDRPLYRPGDSVNIKVWAREFLNARDSRQATAGPVTIEALDPNGLPIAHQSMQLGTDGGDTSFRLPDNAPAGGYELRLTRGNDAYSAAFRVSEYQKPHFEISTKLDQAQWKTGQPVRGRLQLRYPDGKPVRNASIELLLRAQQTTIVQGDLQYMGQFPIKLDATTLQTNGNGEATFTLPAADKPSRYVLSALATDGAAYRVRSTHEILIERAASLWHLRADRQFSDPGKSVQFQLTSDNADSAKPVKWEWVRLEDRSRQSGAVSNPQSLNIGFAQSGSYTVSLLDAAGNVLGAAQHWVSGKGVNVASGNIEIVFDKSSYSAGDTATALVSFPEDASNVLATLERDRVEKTALLAEGADWLHARRITDRQWQITLSVSQEFSPNITFSVAYVRHNHFVFQNQGILVEQPSIKLQFKADKDSYRPGERVNIDVTATLNGKPVAAPFSLGVVDEMIYVLQPEIAPDIRDFFYHPRHNNVRTTASFSFIGYDVSTGKLGAMPDKSQDHERAIKVLERPRRDNVDTAYWNPHLVTAADGHARVSFVMPDALTRWRITARAMGADGAVGQGSAWVRSEKPFYVKWTSPNWLRQGDKPLASIAVFNETDKPQVVDLQLSQGLSLTRKLVTQPGINFTEVPLDEYHGGPINLTLTANGQVVDSLHQGLRSEGLAWRVPQSKWLTLSAASTPLALPADATNVRVSLAPSAAENFARVMDDLVEYPYGCIEQTSSRMVPLTMAYLVAKRSDPARAQELARQLYAHRLQLAHMASPEGRFGWWGIYMPADPFLTGWAYYSDWLAVQALGMQLPPEHWQTLEQVYSDGAGQMSLLQRTLMIDWMRHMKLPVNTLVTGVLADLQHGAPETRPDGSLGLRSIAMDGDARREEQAMAWVLASYMAGQTKTPLSPLARQRIAAAGLLLGGSNDPQAQALLIYTRQSPASKVPALLARISADYPTMDRALMLTWLVESMGGLAITPANVHVAAPWTYVTTLTGNTYFQPPGQSAPALLPLTAAPQHPLAALVSYESASAGSGKPLAVGLSRELYRLTPLSGGGFSRQRVAEGAAVTTDDLYLDEIHLRKAGQGKALFRSLVAVPLPPGASLETSTWGISFKNGEDSAGEGTPMEAARAEPTRYGYAVPVEDLNKSTVYRHLLRFAQKGRFQLPAAYIYSMYDPEARSYEGGLNVVHTLVVR